MIILGYSGYELEVFESYTSGISDVNYLEITNGIYDEVYMREEVKNVDLSANKDVWYTDTRLKATFNEESLSAGNVDNGGIQIEYLIIKRREVGQLNNLNLAVIPFVNDSEVRFVDYLQANKEYIYSVIPYGQGLEGKPNEVSVQSDFVGFFIIDKTDLNNIIAFDKFMGSGSPTVGMQLNEGRSEIKTMSPYPTVYYDDTNYHSFTLQSVFLPKENERSYQMYERVKQMVNKRIPVLIKGSDGSMFIVDLSNIRYTPLMNSHNGYDYTTISVDAVEIDDVENYINDTI